MITLEYDGNIISLPNPDKDDSESFDTGTIYHLSMTGAVYSYRKRVTQNLGLVFSLTKAKKEELEAFYLSYCGQQLTYIDYSSDQWSVRMINNPLEGSTTIGRGSCELWAVNLVLRATYIPSSPAYGLIDSDGNHLTDTDGNYLVWQL